MDEKERQDLREKHRRISHEGRELCDFCSDTAFVGRITYYPCDVTVVLDAWDESLVCDHTTIDNETEKRWWFYCPKCQQMLYCSRTGTIEATSRESFADKLLIYGISQNIEGA